MNVQRKVSMPPLTKKKNPNQPIKNTKPKAPNKATSIPLPFFSRTSKHNSSAYKYLGGVNSRWLYTFPPKWQKV